MVWWNQAPHWHPACLDQDTRASLLTLFAPDELPRNCFYGDGSPIEDEVMDAICAAYQKAEVCFPWNTGDILLLDNLMIAHARNPYQGERKIYVSMGNMMTLQDL
jgi:alpha-ketoglutarate-dependent taurine dioxygenase